MEFDIVSLKFNLSNVINTIKLSVIVNDQPDGVGPKSFKYIFFLITDVKLK